MNVFCKNCRYFKTFVGVLGSYREWCRAPQAKTHRSPGESEEGAPEYINGNNDCKWYVAGRGKHVNLL